MTPDLVDPNSTTITPPADQTLSTETQPSSSPSIDTSGTERELYFQTIREKNQEIARLKAESEARNKAPAKTGEQAWGEFTENPRDLIRSEVAEAVKPINDFIAGLQKGNAFGGLKDQARNMSAQYAKVLDKAGAYVDNALSQANPTLENVIAAINLVAGAITMGQIKGLTIEDLRDIPITPAKVPTPRTVPPTLIPSASPLSRSGSVESAKPWESLTETELAMARMYRMTPEEYWRQSQGDMITVDPTKGGGKK